MSSVISITDRDFGDEVLNSSQPVLAYFWADWCGPCRLVKPSIEWAAQHYSDRLKVVKIEIDPNPHSVKQYEVKGVPGLRLFKESQLIESHEGAITKQQLACLLDNHLN